MRRLFSLLLALLLAAGAAGCARDGGGSSAGASAPGSAAVSVPAEPGVIQDFRLSGYSCQVTIPDGWDALCKTTVYDSGIDFWSPANRDWGGIAFGILLVADGDGDALDFCDGEPAVLSRDEAHHVTFYRVHPYTDVEYDTENDERTAAYQTLLDSEVSICATFTWQYTGQPAQTPADSSAAQSAPTPGNRWQDAYAALLEQVQTANDADAPLCAYALYDVDGDGAPELFLETGTCEADYSAALYRFSGSEARRCGVFPMGHSVLCGLGGDGRFLVQYGQMGHEILSVYTLQDDLLRAPAVVSERDLAPGEDYYSFSSVTWCAPGDSLSWTGDGADTNAAALAALS